MLNNQGPSGCTDYTPLSTEIARRRQNVQSIMGEERGMPDGLDAVSATQGANTPQFSSVPMAVEMRAA
jgi:hypothetical protein